MRKSGSRRLSGSGVGLRAKRLGSGARSPTALRTLDQKRSGVAENLDGQSNLTNSKLAKAIKACWGRRIAPSSA